MARNLQRLFRFWRTPQDKPVAAAQLENSAGGFVWSLDPWARLERFLILGTEGGTFYSDEIQLTRANATNLLALLTEDGVRVIGRVQEVSVRGLAYKNDAALFALALAFTVGDGATKHAAAEALPKVARTGTHLFTFLQYVQSMRGWGRSLRRAVAAWYQDKELSDLSYQVTKYMQREGWSHRDALRLSHPKASGERSALYRYIAHGTLPEGDGPWQNYVRAVSAARTASTDDLLTLLGAVRLPREVLPTESLKDPRIWEQLLPHMPLTAMIRNLATMTRVGLLTPLSPALDTVADALTDSAGLRKARIHPLQVLAALLTYRQGRGMRGRHTWKPLPPLLDALDSAFYLAFQNVEPSYKRVMLALDVSGSMASGTVGGIPGLSPRLASAALALVTAATEPKHLFTAFSHELVPLNISPRQRLDDVLQEVSGLPFGATDCALPMRYALSKGLELDAFVILTDSETWYGDVHPAQALRDYRAKTGIPAKLIVVGMVSNGFSIADPEDAGMLDIVGFSAATPQMISTFLR